MNKFWKWSNGVESTDSKLILEGAISSEDWWGDGLDVTPQAFREELSKRTGDLIVSLNSPGGDVFAGVAIYNSLSAYDKGKITVEVNGLAASIASVIAMAGDEIIMLPGSSMMIHKPWSMGVGNADELEKVAATLNSIEDGIVPIYVSRSGLSEERIKEMLADETWLTPQEAVDLGFADKIVEPKKKVSITESMSALNGQFAFSMSATKDSMTKIIEKMKAEEVKEEAIASPDTPAPTDEVVETPTTVEVEEETQEVTEVTTEQEVQTEAEVVVEAPVDVTNSTKDKDIKMTKQEDIAVTQVLEPKAQATVDAVPKVTVKDYLNTKESMEAFARILEDNAVSASAKDIAGQDGAVTVRNAWKEHLEVKLGVTNPEIFLPTPLIQEIEDAFKTGGEIWQRVSKTGMDSFNAAWDANDDPDAESGRAKGYNRADEEEKAEQTITIANRILRPQFVYKYITLNREDVKEQRSTGALVRFVLSELPKRIIREVERAIVIGDGRAPGSDYEIKKGNPRGFYNVKADATAGNVFASTYTPVPGQTVYETLRRARALVKADGGVILVAKEGLLLDMEFEQNANGGFLFAPGSDLSRYIKVDAVVEPDWMDGDDNDAYIFAYNYYRVVGDQSVEAFQNFLLKTNKNEYLQEIWAGGGLTALKSGVAIAAATS